MYYKLAKLFLSFFDSFNKKKFLIFLQKKIMVKSLRLLMLDPIMERV